MMVLLKTEMVLSVFIKFIAFTGNLPSGQSSFLCSVPYNVEAESSYTRHNNKKLIHNDRGTTFSTAGFILNSAFYKYFCDFGIK